MVFGVRLRQSRLPLLIGFIIFLTFIWNGSPRSKTDEQAGGQSLVAQSDDEYIVDWPAEYQENTTQSDFCEERFGVRYLENLSRRSAQYCQHQSLSDLTCFSSVTETKSGRIDMFCIGGPADYDERIGKFVLECAPQQLSLDQVQAGIPFLTSLPFYWYNTGPGMIFNSLIDLKPSFGIAPNWPTDHLPVTILIKRENLVHNTWHALMEIFSTYMTLDILRITANPKTGLPYFQDSEIDNAQVLIVDDLPEGPYYDLWTLFAEKPMIRLKDLQSGMHLKTGRIIVPLAGGSNPFWQGDWTDLQCHNSSLLRTFARRVIEFHKSEKLLKSPSGPIIITYIDRTASRRLSDQDNLLQSIRENYPDAVVTAFDLATISFKDQLAIARQTDILIGVHGAGLTHGMFLPPQSALIEIMPSSLQHKGFRNMVQMLGHHYVKAQGQESPDTSDMTGSWHFEDVRVAAKVFLDAVEEAVQSIRSRNAVGLGG